MTIMTITLSPRNLLQHGFPVMMPPWWITFHFKRILERLGEIFIWCVCRRKPPRTNRFQRVPFEPSESTSELKVNLLGHFSRITTPGRTFLPQIDGLRFVAIMAVIAYHVRMIGS